MIYIIIFACHKGDLHKGKAHRKIFPERKIEKIVKDKRQLLIQKILSGLDGMKITNWPLNKYFSIIGQYHSEYDAGAGINIRY
jgi:hypothetical protein